MHERSLVKTLIELAAEEVKVRQLGKVREIQVEIGEFSGVEPRLVESAFSEMAPEYWSESVLLTVAIAPLQARCRQCHDDFPVIHFQFICPRCGSSHVQVTSGEEIRLLNIVVEPPSI